MSTTVIHCAVPLDFISVYPKHQRSDFRTYIRMYIQLYPHSPLLDGQHCSAWAQQGKDLHWSFTARKNRKEEMGEALGNSRRTWWEGVAEELKDRLSHFSPWGKGFKLALTSKRYISQTFLKIKQTLLWVVPSERFLPVHRRLWMEQHEKDHGHPFKIWNYCYR